MSLKATVFFAIWTSFFCSVFNWLYLLCPMLQGHPWIMFICLAVFFGMNLTHKDVPHLLASAACGVFWGQVDLWLMTFGVFGSALFGFMPILVGTAITMVLHIFFFAKTPVRDVPIIFACVALTFATKVGLLDGPGILGLFLSVLVGLVLCGICAVGQQIGMKKFPLSE